MNYFPYLLHRVPNILNILLSDDAENDVNKTRFNILFISVLGTRPALVGSMNRNPSIVFDIFGLSFP